MATSLYQESIIYSPEIQSKKEVNESRKGSIEINNSEILQVMIKFADNNDQ